MVRNRMEECLDALIDSIVDDTPTPAQRQQMEALDRQFIEIQRHAERHCRRKHKPQLDFSPEVKLWYECMQTYKALLQWKKGNTARSNVIRMALSCGIENPRALLIEHIEAAVAFTCAEYHSHQSTHKELRSQHLWERIVSSSVSSPRKPEGARRAWQQLEDEGRRKMWFCINRTMKDPRCPAPHFDQQQQSVANVIATHTSQS